MDKQEDKQPFLGHLEELRKRLIASAIAVAIGFAGCYFFAERIFQILIEPLKAVMPEGDSLIFTSLPEMFLTSLKVALVSGVLLAAPLLFYEMWMFVTPGLYRNEKKLVIPFVISSTILFVGGALFGYFIVFPFAFKFLMGFASDSLQALPSMREYFNIAVKLLLAFGITFETPVFIFFLAKVGIVNYAMLKSYRKYAIMVSFVAAAFLTPPDVFTQVMMALPLVVLFELSLLIIRISEKKS